MRDLTSLARSLKSPFQDHKSGKAEAMRRDGCGSEREGVPRVAANDNGGPDARIDAAVMRLARLFGRQIARERFEATQAANDNAPPENEAHDR